MSTFAASSLRTLTRASLSSSGGGNAVASSSRLARPLSTSAVRLAEGDKRAASASSTPSPRGARKVAPSSTAGSLAATFESISSPVVLPGAPSVAPTQAGAGPTTTGYTGTTLPPTSDPLISVWINLLMRDGKKAQATTHILAMLRHIGTWLHTDPLPALASAVHLASPLVRTQTSKAGGKSVALPLALNERQSRRRGIVAIMEASKKRGERELSTRLAKEVCAVLEGNSSVLAKKEELHKFATVNRSNLSVRV